MILLIEDNQTDIELTRRAFIKGNIDSELVVKEDGQEALNYLFGAESSTSAAVSVLPDLILLDLKMPKISGLEVLRHIRQNARTRRIPVVVLTSSVEESDLAAAYNLCANSYIRKPVDFKEFVDAVKALCHYWLELNEPSPL
ncbi:MAG: two-component system response regulator [Candidatus Riflebacteria bacterium GWC2_50_8]|nr:MAG: two-component system response regulator [Candidatus Riflebacteria bacterium GWC2_50_8]